MRRRTRTRIRSRQQAAGWVQAKVCVLLKVPAVNRLADLTVELVVAVAGGGGKAACTGSGLGVVVG